MANDHDTTSFSPTALSTPRISTSSPSSSSPLTTSFKSPMTDLRKPSLNVNVHADERRTQSATDLRVDVQRTASPTTTASPSPSPRNSLVESLSRSNSFLAASVNFFTSNNNGSSPSSPTSSSVLSPPVESIYPIKITYVDQGPLFVDLYSRADGRGAFVKSFRRKPDGTMGQAEASGQVRLNDMLYSINDLVVTEMLFPAIIQAAKSASFPCTLVFHSRLPPPSSPTVGGQSPAKNNTTWSTKFGQMMNDTSVLKRTGSFERTIEQPSPLRPPRQTTPTQTPTPPTSTSGGETPGKPTKWGDSITLEKVKNSDGVKNLLRMMGGRTRPEEDRETVATWFDHLELKIDQGKPDTGDGAVSSSVIAVTTGGRLVGVRDEDQSEFVMTWFRKTSSNDLIQVKGVRRGRYYPSVDDASARLSLRCQSLRFSNLSKVVELPQPIEIDPAVKDMVEILLEAGAGSFSATLASNDHDSFQIKITADRVNLVKVSEEEEDAGVVVSVNYQPYLQVLLDPTDQLRFTLKVQELGSMLGNKSGDTCDVRKRQQLLAVSCFFLVAQNPQHRDIMALLIRRFRAQRLTEDEEAQAHRDEMNLFVDPASAQNAGMPTHSATAQVDNATSVTTAAAASGSQTRNSMSGASSNTDSPSRSLVVGAAPMSPAVRLSDLFGENENDERRTEATSTQPTVASAVDGGFMKDRLTAQEKEIAMLQEKLASLSVLVKSTEHEKSVLKTALEVKDKRIESQQMRLQQLERSNVQLLAQGRELHTLKVRLDEESKLHAACQQQLAQAIAAREAAEMVHSSSQTDQDVEIPDSHRIIFEETKAHAATLAQEVDQLRRELTASQTRIDQLQQANVTVTAERNSYRSRSVELAKEIKKLVGTHRSIDEVEAQLAERSHLAAQLAIARAEAKRATDEMQEYKDALDLTLKQHNMADKEKGGTQRLISQNMELQRLVHQLTESLNEAKEQMSALKRINLALMEKLQREDPDFRGSIIESPPMSPQSACLDPRFSDEDDDDDEEDDDEDEDGDERDDLPAHLVRSPGGTLTNPMPPTPPVHAAQDDSDDEEAYGDAVEGH